MLASPLVRNGFLWDDYIFLNGALAGGMRAFLPDPTDAFYRPLARGLWFGLVSAAGSWGPALAHAGNALLLAAAVALLSRLALRLAGPSAGFASAMFFAGFGALPFLVGWASGCQDLLALLFLLAAAHLELSGRTAGAMLCAALALLSKETASAALPALAFAPWLLSGGKRRTARSALRYGVLLAAWIAAHPGVRTLLLRGFRAGATGYVGLSKAEDWLPSLLRYTEVLANWPVTGLATPWPGGLTAAFGAAVAILLAGIRGMGPAAGPGGAGSAPGHKRIALWGALFALPPLLPAVTLLDAWSPYYAVSTAAGLSLGAGVLVCRAPRPLLAVALSVYLGLGVWSRGADLGAAGPCERWLQDAQFAVGRVHAGLDRLLPRVPPQSRILVAVHTPATRRVLIHLYFYQALRVWRHDPTLLTVRPDWRPPGDGPAFLLGVEPDYSVFAIDPATLTVRSEGPAPDPIHVRRTLRYHAWGLARGGGTDRGVAVLQSIPGGDSSERSVDLRIAAMLLTAEGRGAEAAGILRNAPPLPRERAISEVTELLTDAPDSSRWDGPALQAFGFAPGDAEVCRVLTQNFIWGRRPEAAWRFAERLRLLRPRDPDAAAARRYLERMKGPERFALPAPPDVVERFGGSDPRRSAR
ncbi:MAG TPA: hypothetical protein VID50_08095 [Candidatus Eisenbacteria bacterium]